MQFHLCTCTFLTGLKKSFSVVFRVSRNQAETLNFLVSLKWNLSFIDLGNTKQCFIFFLLSMLEYKYESIG